MLISACATTHMQLIPKTSVLRIACYVVKSRLATEVSGNRETTCHTSENIW
uniref:Uncharacterized protein n=1 Tax=Manihot esculenta TaxID=3983 RepID=A0A2C9WPF8_MANES